jgi:hypothetical protein
VAKPKEPGWKKHITPEVVERVSKRCSYGLRLTMALAIEKNPKINERSWAKALKRNPAFSAEFEAAQARFYYEALSRLVEDDNPKWLCWVLEHCHAGLFRGDPDDTEEIEEEQQEIVGVPNDVLARAREYARRFNDPRFANETGPCSVPRTAQAGA